MCKLYVTLVLAAIGFAAFGVSARAEGTAPADTPEALKGFRGVLVGTITAKREKSFVLKVEEIAKAYPRSEAAHPEGAVGQSALVSIAAGVRPAGEVEKMLKTLTSLAVGARVRVGVITRQGDLIAVEELSAVTAGK